MPKEEYCVFILGSQNKRTHENSLLDELGVTKEGSMREEWVGR